MKRDAKEIVIAGVVGEVCIRRMAHGFPHIVADDEMDRYYGLGYAHGRDRQMQMWLLKLIGHGKASACLTANENLIAADKFMHWLNVAGDATEEVQRLPADMKAVLDAYCKGVNDAVKKTGTPFEFKLMGYTPDEWTPADALLMAKLIGFVGLSQVQGDQEKLIIQLLQKGLDSERLKELFPAIEEEITEDFVALLQKVNVVNPVVSPSIVWRDLLPNFSASNNWAIRPEKTASGKAILCGDPHLALQLPSVWYLAVLAGEDDYLMGATVPGLPAVAVGRTPHLSWSATYGTSDTCDYFIEEIKDGKYKRGDEWVSLTVREEVIQPKKQDPITVRVYETEHGLLEGEPDEDGYYLCYAWTGKQKKNTGAESLDNVLKITNAKGVEEAQDYFAGLTFASFNWVFADKAGNIGYQLGGLVPKQAKGTSGLLPYLGWDKKQDWDGVVDPKLYPRAFNPECGYIVTANQDLNAFGQIKPMKLPMSSYRADRVTELLQGKNELTVEDMKLLHYDRFALQAKAFMKVIRPLLPDSENGDILRAWNCCYDADSLGATLFERIYRELVVHVFGDQALGADVVTHILDGTSVFNMLHGHFDRILLSETSAWFGDLSREELYAMAIERGLKENAIPHGEASKLYVEHLFFRGNLPRFLGFDYPLSHIGSRSTVAQAGVFKGGSFAATLRMICDFSEDVVHAHVAGGASDRRFSKYYTSGLAEWERGDYSVLDPSPVC